MCTVIVAIAQWPHAPLVVLANRDERLDRPAGPPAWREHHGERVFAPVDLLASGTWIGVSASGMMAAITNRFGAPRDDQRASRGSLVLDALAQGDLHGVARWMERDLDPERTNPFHLIVSDGRGGHLAWTEGTRIFRESLGPGFHLVSERSFGPAPSPREDRIWEAIPTLNTAQPPDPEIAREFLAHHDDDPAQATCVHLEALGYGTRSWTHILYQREPGGFVWHEADGPPCTTPAVQVLPELPISG